MKRTHLKKVYILAAMLLATAPAGNVSAEKGAVEPVSETEPAAVDNHTPPAGLDPFSYNVPPDSRGFLPSLTGSVPAGVRVMGIMSLSGSKPIAALSFPGYEEPFFVQENDLIAVSIKTAGIRAGKKGGARHKKKHEIVYVQVGHITGTQVELFPKTNPSNIQILR